MTTNEAFSRKRRIFFSRNRRAVIIENYLSVSSNSIFEVYGHSTVLEFS